MLDEVACAASEGSAEDNALLQWHPAFCSALRLELRDNKNDLEFLPEYTLGNKPLQIDVLVINKRKDVGIKNAIGHIFRAHNIFEYKSPDDKLNIDTFFKGLAYACLYKSQGMHVNERSVNDITLTFIRHTKPLKLLQDLQRLGYHISNESSGIYYIAGPITFMTQIVVSQELPPEDHVWLQSLSRNLAEDDISRLVTHTRELSTTDEQDYADSVMNITARLNMNLIQSIMGGTDEMCEALRIFFQPELDAKDLEIEQRDNTIARQQAELARQQTALAQQQDVLVQQQNALLQKDAQIAALEQRIAILSAN